MLKLKVMLKKMALGEYFCYSCIHDFSLYLIYFFHISYAKYYAKVMEKIIQEGEPFLKKEKARVTKILNDENVAPLKKDDFNIRQNILYAFDKSATPVEN